ncbi:MAG: carboxypeptidase regulatory-like domain-containing protein [bacterium]|nr:carboxypeptidase regulatory-like domain-containing protein [bacterium]
MHPLRPNTYVPGLLVLLLALLAQDGFAQFDTLWTRQFTLTAAARVYSVAEISTGGYAAAGFIQAGQDNALLMVVNPLGDTLWTRTIGNSNASERAFDVVQLVDGTIVICGFSQSAFSLFVAGFSTNGQQLWYREFDPPGACQADAILPLADGGFWLLGRKPVAARGADFWLIRCNANGDSLFSNTFGTTGEDLPTHIFLGDNGTLDLIGSTRVPPASDNNFDFLRIELDETGALLHLDTVGTERWEQVHGAARDSVTGELLIVGERRVTTSDKDALALRMNAGGAVLWDQAFSDSFITERFTGAATYLEGGALFGGYVGGSSESSYRLWLVAVTSNGDTAWTWLGNETGRAFDDLIRTADGGFVACGRANVNAADRPLMWRVGPPSGISGFVRDRLTGEPIPGVRVQASSLPQYSVSDTLGRFTLSLPEGNYRIYSGGPCFTGDTLNDVDVQPNENTLADITVGVAHASVNHTTINVLAPNRGQGASELVVANAGSGDLVYRFETQAIRPAGNWLSVEPASGRIVPGDTLIAQVIVTADTTDDGNYDYFGEVRLLANSCPETLRVFDVLAVVLDADQAPALPSEFALYPAFPNPFNSATRLRFGLDHESDVSLRIYDVTGRTVATLLDRVRLSAGEHSLDFAPNGLASGLYFVRLEDRTRSESQRLLYLR